MRISDTEFAINNNSDHHDYPYRQTFRAGSLAHAREWALVLEEVITARDDRRRSMASKIERLRSGLSNFIMETEPLARLVRMDVRMLI